MPRSPLITQAVRDLAKYFAATTDAAFIDRTWSINTIASDKSIREGTQLKDNPKTRAESFSRIAYRSLEYTEGTETADHIANLINGAVSIGEFLTVLNATGTGKIPNGYDAQIKLYAMNGSNPVELENAQQLGSSYLEPNTRFKESALKPNSQHPNVNIYAANVYNPFMGPMTKDTGALEIFMNGIPTLEFSKCVPYLNVEVISLLRTAGTVAPPLTLTGFLNPPALGTGDAAMLAAQGTIVRTEASTLGGGLRSGMELFTAPQTLVNMGPTGAEFVPVIDRMRPLASLGNLSLSTKIQGGTLSFTTGRLEITVHDRSRLREMAAFVRPDLYGTTFLDITYGWSHPEGGLNTLNSYGKFLDALRSTTRFRIAGSTYTFEEGGQIKVTLNIQTVGSTDLLYLGPKEVPQAMKELQKIIRQLNELLVEKRARNTTPSMAEYDFLAAFQDPSSALAAASDKNVLQKVRKLLETLSDDDRIAQILKEMLGEDLAKDAEQAAEGSAIDRVGDALVGSYTEILNQLPTYGDNDALGQMTQAQFDQMLNNTFLLSNPSTGTPEPVNDKEADKSSVIDRGVDLADKDKVSKSDFISYGAAFMNMIAKPLKESGQYDEVQVVFYPFNKYAGSVHDMPISSFPMEKNRFKKAVEDLARKSPNVSCRQLIGMMYDRFTHFAPARAYLMAGFYDQKKAESGIAERYTSRAVRTINVVKKGKNVPVKVAISEQLTFEQRLEVAGIPEKRFVLPQVQVAVEGSPLLKANGEPMLDDRGNPKTLIKIHVYDSAMDPHSTLTDIIRAAKDNELGVITAPVAETNAAIRASSEVSAILAAKATDAIQAGKDLGILEEVGTDSLQAVNEPAKNVIEGISKGSFYRVKGGYDEIKKLVTAGIPTITYGSSMTAITNAQLTSNTSPGLGNVQLLRAFTEPGEVRAESLTSGVPMLVVPSQLSISTIGCPLFSPMQRLYIDFGTGTSIDNLYNVISIDSTIGRDGFKTDVKLGFADGFASYRSLNQNLALLALSMQKGTTSNPSDPSFSGAQSRPGAGLPFPTPPLVDPNKIIESNRKFIRNIFKSAALPLAQLEAREKAKLEAKLRKAAEKVAAKIEAEKQKVEDEINALIPAEVQLRIDKAQQDIAKAAAEVQEKAEPVIRAARLAKTIADVIILAETLPAGIGAIVIAEALAAVDEARSQAAANTQASPNN